MPIGYMQNYVILSTRTKVLIFLRKFIDYFYHFCILR